MGIPLASDSSSATPAPADAETCREPRCRKPRPARNRSSGTLAVSFRSFLVRTRKGQFSPIRRSRFPAAHGSAPYKLPRRKPCIPSRTGPVGRNARGFFSFFSCPNGKRTVLPHKKERFPFSQRETVFFFIYSRRRRHTRNADSARWAP